MINEALLVAYKHAEAERKEAEFIDNLKQLPMEELRQVVATGEIKLAFLEPSESPGRSSSWLDTFKGTPFFEQAIALEQEELQMAMANSQSSSVTQQKQQQEWTSMDQIRLKKRLLELQKARNEAQVLAGGGGPPNMAGSSVTGPGAEAQGAGALGPVAPEGQQDGMGDAHKLGSMQEKLAKYEALKRTAETVGGGATVFGTIGAAAGAGRKAQPNDNKFKNRHPVASGALHGAMLGGVLGAGVSPDLALHPGRVGKDIAHLAKDTAHAVGTKGRAAASHIKDTVKARLLHGEGKKKAEEGADKMLGMMKKKSSIDADAFAREMARYDMAKVARAQELLAIGDATGRALHKVGGVLGQVGQWALEHPGKAGAIAGGTLGAAHGLLKQDGGLGSAITEGAAGAGLGHAAGSIAGGTRSLQGTLGERVEGSAKMYGAHMKNEAMRLSDKLKKSVQPPEASLGGAQVQKID